MIPLSIIPINVLSNSNHKQPIYLDVLIDVIQQPTDQHYYLVIYIEFTLITQPNYYTVVLVQTMMILFDKLTT